MESGILKVEIELEGLSKAQEEFEQKKKQANELFQEKLEKTLREEKRAIEERLKSKLKEENEEQ